MSEQKEPTGTPQGLLRSVLPDYSEQARYERALGQLAMNFSFLHAVLEMFGWKVWKLTQPARSILTKDLPVKQLVGKLRESVPHAMVKENDRNDFLVILKKIEQAAEKRNNFLHSLWVFNGEKPVSCVRWKGRKRGTESMPSLDEIKKFNRSIMGILLDLKTFEDRDPLKSPLLLALEEFISKDRVKSDGQSDSQTP
jgi:hypothetical protein